MGRRAIHHGSAAERGLGTEIRRHREKVRLSFEIVGVSGNTLSRLERGLRPETTVEEIGRSWQPSG